MKITDAVTRSTALVLLVVCSMVLFSACEAEDDDRPAVDVEAEAAAILDLERAWSANLADGNLEGIMSIHASDAIQFPPGAPAVFGAEALRAVWEGMINTEGLQVSWEPTEAVVAPSGDMAYDYGSATMITPDGTETPMKYLVVWVRENGEWKVAADMFNANVAPENP